jgi:hypothetical protein
MKTQLNSEKFGLGRCAHNIIEMKKDIYYFEDQS